MAGLQVLSAALLLASSAAAGEPPGRGPAPAVRQLGVAVASAAYAAREGDRGACQPEDFVPGATTFHKVRTGGRPPELYRIDGMEEDAGFQIDGWMREGEGKVRLPRPFDLTYYEFGCASDSSFVLEVRKDGRLHALHQHVEAFRADTKGLRLFLRNNRRLPDGRYEGFTGLIDIPSNRETPLPALPCLTGFGGKALFAGRWLLTYARTEEESYAETELCAWDAGGRLQARMRAGLLWGDCGSECSLLDRIGVLPNEPRTMYVQSAFGGHSRQDCRMVLVDLAKPARMRTLGPDRVARGVTTLDWRTNATPNRCEAPTLKLEELSWDGARPGP